MADSSTEARIRDLKRRLELEPGSRLFVALAEEYRKTGRFAEALSTLQKGLLAHPQYLSAHVALGRAYLEAGQITEAIATFSKVLSSDPGNLVSAKSLADIFLSRGDSVEAIKKYKLYRALAGDRSVDAIIERLEMELAPPPPLAQKGDAPPPPPPPFYEGAAAAPTRRTRETASEKPAARARPMEDLEVAPVAFEPDDSGPRGHAADEAIVPLPLSRDTPLMAIRTQQPPAAPTLPLPAAVAPPPDAVTGAIRPAEILASLPPPPTPPPPAAPQPPSRPLFLEETPAAEGGEPRGRVLADLYFAQGHFAEALAIYDDLVAANPQDEELRRLRRDAEARLLPAAATVAAAASPDTALERRLAKIRALKRWLAVVQTA
ncbi:MAG TPA: tetratricopeptide repeat protein [Thermoanaerobaculia bacterium]|nr:tetratricopeptide repeat protein [Thermoanaerobaculia bacterium]